MKKVILGLVLVAFASCEYKDIAPRICYLASEHTQNGNLFYSYNSKNELASYANVNIASSVLTYDDSGKIISELDNGNIQINYTYDQNKRLVLWTELIVGYPSPNLQIKFSYNAAGQDTLKQIYKYNTFSGNNYLWRSVRMSYSSANTTNYSQRKTYDAYSILLYTEDFLWDNHPNPYLTNAFFLNEPPSSNNILQYTYTPAGRPPSVTNFIYTYNGNGFPLTQTIPGFAVVDTYTYTNCD